MKDEEYRAAAVDRLDCVYEPRVWPFAVERAVEIDRHWTQLTAANPKLYNGRVLLQHRGGIAAEGASSVFRGAYFETDYSAFLAWRDFGYPGPPIRNCFALAALRSADGAFLVGEMAAHTANPGRVYFPAGTPDPDDVRAGQVDLAGSAARELVEETGLEANEVEFEPSWTLLLGRHRIACIKVAQARSDAAPLVARIEAFLHAQREPELARIHAIRGPSDCTGLDLPGFMLDFFRRTFGVQ